MNKIKIKKGPYEGQDHDHIFSTSQNKYCKTASLLSSLTPLCLDRYFIWVSLHIPSPYNTPNHPLIHLQHHPAHAVPPHPVSKLGHASQPTAHTFLSSSSFWTLIHLWSDSVQFSLRGIQDYCTYTELWWVGGGVRVLGCEEKGGGGQWKEGRKGDGSSGGVVSKIWKKNDMRRRRLFFGRYRNTSFVPERSVCECERMQAPLQYVCGYVCVCVGEPCLRCHP